MDEAKKGIKDRVTTWDCGMGRVSGGENGVPNKELDLVVFDSAPVSFCCRFGS
jgi:hypothetical protein